MLTSGTLQAHPGFAILITIPITFYYCEQKFILFLTGF